MSAAFPPYRPYYDEETGFYHARLDDPDRLARKANQKRREATLKDARRRGTHTPAQWAALKAFCNGCCLACGQPDSPRIGGIIRDHIVPLAKGGSDAIENLQPMCRPCNSRKGVEAFDLRPPGWRVALVAAGVLK